MPTKKKVATKGVGKKAASAKKVTPSRKAAKPVRAKVTSRTPVKETVQLAEKSIASKPEKKKMTDSTKKPSDKSGSPKAVKPAQGNAAVKKAEAGNASSKKEKEGAAAENQAVKAVVTPLPAGHEVIAEEAVIPVQKPSRTATPDTRSKTARKYEPDFTKSVLDAPLQENNGPSQRYSDADLSEFRELINKKMDAAKKELNYLQGLITRKDDMGGDESDNRYMTMEDGSISMEREQLSQMASRQITFIDHLEKAVMRIENKTYGICRVTGKLIDKARLRAVPHATLSIEAKHMQHR